MRWRMLGNDSVLHRELLILQPATAKPGELEELKEDKPFVMRGVLPAGAQFVQFLTIPTIVDMIGFSSGGGPPAFAYLINPKVSSVAHSLWFMVSPGAPFDLPTEGSLESSFLGVAQCLGMLFGAVHVVGEEGLIDALAKQFEDAGSSIFQMVPYKTPDMLRQRVFPRAP